MTIGSEKPNTLSIGPMAFGEMMMGKLKNAYHDELERRRAYEDEMFGEDELNAEQDRLWAEAKAAKARDTMASALARDKIAAMRSGSPA